MNDLSALSMSMMNILEQDMVQSSIVPCAQRTMFAVSATALATEHNWFCFVLVNVLALMPMLQTPTESGLFVCHWNVTHSVELINEFNNCAFCAARR